MTEFDRLVKQASKAAQKMGGLLAILLAIKAHKANKVEWDGSEARFKVNGKQVPIDSIRKELARMELSIANTVIKYNNNLWTKKWTIRKWREEMVKLIEESHMLFGALAIGGLVLAARDANILRRKDRDLKAVERFTYSMSKGLVASLPLRNSRAKSYIRSFSVTYNILSQRMHIIAGYNEAKRILHVAEHCRSKGLLAGCLETAARGWIPIREMPPIGTLVCKQFCKCWILYRRNPNL